MRGARLSKPVFGRGGRRKRRRQRAVPPRGAWGFWPIDRDVNWSGIAAARVALEVLNRPFREAPLFWTADELESLQDDLVGIYDAHWNLESVMPQRVLWYFRERGGKAT